MRVPFVASFVFAASCWTWLYILVDIVCICFIYFICLCFASLLCFLNLQCHHLLLIQNNPDAIMRVIFLILKNQTDTTPLFNTLRNIHLDK